MHVRRLFLTLLNRCQPPVNVAQHILHFYIKDATSTSTTVGMEVSIYSEMLSSPPEISVSSTVILGAEVGKARIHTGADDLVAKSCN